MPNKKISELNQITTLSNGDQLLVTDISEAIGSKSKYVTVQQFDDRYATFNPTITPYGEMYQQNNTTLTTIDTANVWVKIENYIVGLLNGVTYLDSQLTSSTAGVFVVNVNISAETNDNRPFEFGVFLNDVLVTKLQTARFFESGKSGSLSLKGLVSLVENDVLDIRTRNTDDNKNITVGASNFTIIGI